MLIGDIEIIWTGHSGFLIIFEGIKIYIDPYKLIPGVERADVVLITHSHYDHCSIEDLKRIVKDGTRIICTPDCQSKLAKLEEKINVKMLEPGNSVDIIAGLKIKAVPAYNTNKQFHPKDDYWNGYIIEVGNKRIYHAGDTDVIPEMKSLGKIDVACLPVGGTYTMTAKEAVEAAKIIRPGIAFPMHYGEVVGSEEDALKFVQGCEEEGINAKKLVVGK